MNGKLNSQTVKIVFGWITTAVILRFYFVITSNLLKIKTISNSHSFPFFSSFSQLKAPHKGQQVPGKDIPSKFSSNKGTQP